MLIKYITEYCNLKYDNKIKCSNCSYNKYCPDDCGKCLEYIHFPNKAPKIKKYDCPNMANFYTCKYAYKYMSELVYALNQLKDLKEISNLKVMSIGCGPCTDLFALDYVDEKGEYEFKSLEFRGIDPAKMVWEDIHENIKKHSNDKYDIRFYYKDIIEYVDIIVAKKWVPDLIIFQYVFSDMEKHCSKEKFVSFISKIANFINNDMKENTYIIINDINLTTTKGGGRERFDELLDKISNYNSRKYHFNNNNKTKHYEYGEEYKSNNLVLNVPDYLLSYDPYISCASAQLIIKKVKK